MIMPVSVALSNSMDERISAASSKPQPEKGAKTAGGRTYAGRGDGLHWARAKGRVVPQVQRFGLHKIILSPGLALYLVHRL